MPSVAELFVAYAWASLPATSILVAISTRVLWWVVFNFSPLRHLVVWYPCFCIALVALTLLSAVSFVTLYPILGSS